MNTGTDELPALVVAGRPGGELTWVSREWTRLTGQAVADALGWGWSAHVRAEETGAIHAALGRMGPGDPPLTARFQVRRADGTWATLVGRFEVAPAGELRGVAVEVEDGQAQVSDGPRAVVDALPDTLLQVDAGLMCTGMRVGSEGPFLEPSRWVGRPLVEGEPAALARLLHAPVVAALSTGSARTFEGEVNIAGDTRALEARAMPVLGGAMVLLRDVTEAKTAEARLVKAREAALLSSRHKSHFLASLSHEIRTPLNGVLGVAQLLRAWNSLPPEALEYLGVLEAAGDSLLALVNDVLDLSRIEANRLELEASDFDLEEAVSHATRSLMPEATRKGLTLSVELAPPARGQARGDATRLKQIIHNLLGNAVKFTDHGEVRLSVSRSGDEVTLAVTDTGPGIPPEEQALVFEPFGQGSQARRRNGGTGLGLSIARELTRLMGGELTLSSQPGQGSTFVATVRLPSISRPVPAMLLVTPAPTRALRVLIAEDNELNAQMMRALVTQLGHTVKVVSDGHQAVAAVAGGGFDVVMMDVRMPGLDGLEATRAIRALEHGTRRHIPIVALTAHAMKGDDLTCLSAGMDAYLAKPVTAESLKDLLTWFGSGQGTPAHGQRAAGPGAA